MERCAAWHHPMTRAEAERLTDKAIRPSPWLAIIMAAILLAGMIGAVAANSSEDCGHYSHRESGDYRSNSSGLYPCLSSLFPPRVVCPLDRQLSRSCNRVKEVVRTIRSGIRLCPQEIIMKHVRLASLVPAFAFAALLLAR